MKLFRARTAAALLALLQPLLPATVWARDHRAAGHMAHPAVWKVSKGASTVYLFGTIHALPPHFEWETGAIKTAIAQSDRLVIEAVIDPDQTKSAQALMRIGTATTTLPPVADRVSPKFRGRLAAMIARSQLPPEMLDKLKTWAVGMVLFGPSIAKLGVSSAEGVEEQLKAEFHAAGKPIEGLETLDQQLGFFDTLTEPQQRDFLESVLDEKSDDASDFGKMIGAWSHGDEKGIAASFDKVMKKSDALRTVLIARRDAHWADAIVARLATPGTQLVAVGAGHLVGSDSVQANLAKLGYTATRVE